MKISNDSVSFCIPITAANFEELKKDLEAAVQEHPEFIEFRRDYFTEENAEDKAFACFKQVRDNGIGVIYTYRDKTEGGFREVSSDEKIASAKKALESHCCDYVDIEKVTDPFYTSEIVDMVLEAKVGLIRSIHNFDSVPSYEAVMDKLEKCSVFSDVVKAAYYCNSIDDVMVLIQVGRDFKKKHHKPLVLVAMGPYGIVSRVIPEMLSSSLSYTAGKRISAPGQISLEDTETVRRILELKPNA